MPCLIFFSSLCLTSAGSKILCPAPDRMGCTSQRKRQLSATSCRLLGESHLFNNSASKEEKKIVCYFFCFLSSDHAIVVWSQKNPMKRRQVRPQLVQPPHSDATLYGTAAAISQSPLPFLIFQLALCFTKVFSLSLQFLMPDVINCQHFVNRFM